MKYSTKHIAFAALLALLAGGSCDYLDKAPDDELTMDMVFRDKTRTEDWLAGVYSAIPDPYWEKPGMKHYDIFADDYLANSGWAAYGGWGDIPKLAGNWNSESSWEGNYWEKFPARIRAAYIFINNVKANVEQGVTQEEVDLMKAECRFLIAYYYYLLVNTYGAIPLQTWLSDFDTPVEELLIGQEPYDRVIDWVDAELQSAAGKLPAYYNEPRKYGRATSVMCMAVRARMLLFAASPLVNGNQRVEYASYVNSKGEHIFSAKYEPEKWERAAKACKELIDLAHDNGYALYYEYNADGSIDPFMSYSNMSYKEFNQGNKEILFARPFDNVTSEHNKHATPNGLSGNGGLGVTQSLVDAFFMSNGRPPILGYNPDGSPKINAESGYSESGFSTKNDSCKTKWIEAQGASSNNDENPVTNAGTYMMYCNREPRFYVSVLFNEAWHRIGNRKVNFFLNGADNPGNHDSPENGYLLRKRVHPNVDVRNGTYPYRPGILYRLGEAYLNYAEALNECNPSHPDILLYLNKIRERAGIPTYGTDVATQIPVPASQDDMREAIHRERRVELNCEFAVRFDDIRRWNKVVELLSGDVYGMNRYG
ncbi:MAG: RagB/SusD family nutrient uptake outer membrane protein, partial [Prevotellaceae bacterium]|nr:RagB/SusD family nutrient uptake outer membrane protein [Prevotellaceae bacterium]